MKEMKPISRQLKWKCHLPNLLEEILCNKGAAALKIPINITKSILGEVAERAIELNDPILNELMCDLQLYETPQITTPEYRKFMEKVRTAAEKQKKEEQKNINNKSESKADDSVISSGFKTNDQAERFAKFFALLTIYKHDSTDTHKDDIIQSMGCRYAEKELIKMKLPNGWRFVSDYSTAKKWFIDNGK